MALAGAAVQNGRVLQPRRIIPTFFKRLPMTGHVSRLHLRAENRFHAVLGNAASEDFAAVSVHNIAVFEQMPVMRFQTALHFIAPSLKRLTRFRRLIHRRVKLADDILPVYARNRPRLGLRLIPFHIPVGRDMVAQTFKIFDRRFRLQTEGKTQISH